MPRHAEIAGAGVAGLGLACRLRQLGWSVRVHERASHVRDGGAAISLGQNGVDPLRLIGALDAALEGGVPIDYWNIVDQRGRVLQEDHVTSELYSIPRSSMLRSVYERALELGAEVVTDSPVQGFDAGALVLESGERLPADLVVGADGAWSRMRESFAEHGIRVRVKDLRTAGLRANMPRGEGDPETGMWEWLNGQRRVGLLPLDGGLTYIYMFAPEHDTVGRRTPIDVESWSQSFPFLRGAFERVPADAAYRDILEVHVGSWVHENAVLLGDAAFGMAPNLGQGACTALQAGMSLAAVVNGADDIPAALRVWQQLERPHVDYVQRWSGRYSRWCSHTPTWATDARSLAFTVWGRSRRLQRRFAGVEVREPVHA